MQRSYNIRGWLTDINDVGGTASGFGVETDLFNFRINYNKLEGDYNSTGIVPLYNGNIAETIWKTDNVNKEKRSYGYMYDPLNRINKAGNRSGVNLDNIDDDFTFTLWNVNYDKNGNIETLRRSGKFTSQYYDNLIYNYEDNSNKLLGVIDISTCNCDEKGFNDTNNSNLDYTYDLNGNLLTDENKGITTPITYNHLNLPVEIAITNTLESGTISYVYDATGVKLEKKFINTTGIIPHSITTQYAGNYVYSDNEIEGTMMLEFFNHPEGYVIPLPDNPDGTKNEKSVKSFTTDPGGGPGNITYSSYSYVFQYKDHLGNIRLSYADLDGNGSINPNEEIIEENNFFPFGLKHWGYNNVVSSNGNSLAQQWKFGGKQLDQSLGLETYDFGARNYDATLGRWMNVDPLAHEREWLSPYNFVQNNPINRVDPTGALDDWVGTIDDNGNTTWSWNENITSAEQAKAAGYDDYKAPGSIIDNAKIGGGEKGSVYLGYSASDFSYTYSNNTVTPFQVGTEWLTGNGPRNRNFFAGDNFTEMLKTHDHIQNAHITIGDRIANNKEHKPISYSLAGVQGVGKYVKDYSTLLTAGQTGNLAVTYLGSYSLAYTFTDVDVQRRTARIHFTINNSSSIQSATRPPIIGYTEAWKNGPGKWINNAIQTGPMSTTRQSFN